MSRFPVKMPRIQESDDVSVRPSVGGRIEADQVYDMSHPSYQQFVTQLSGQIDVIARRENARKASSQPAVVPYALSSAATSELSDLYPEFNVVPVPLNFPVHGFWMASRYVANELLVSNSLALSSEVVHLGGSRLSAMMRGARGVHCEWSSELPEEAHRHHSVMVDIHRVFRDYSHMQTEYGVAAPRLEFDAYVSEGAYKACSDRDCVESADVVALDLSAYSLSPEQVAAYMIQHDAEVANGFFIYHPTMLMQDKGELPGTGVHYEVTSRRVRFLYPEGQSGVSGYSKPLWSAWLVSHAFKLPGTDLWFHLELLQNRGSFMFFRMARVPPPEGTTRFVHALELPMPKDPMVMVEGWRLKHGLKSDSNAASSWESYWFMAPERVMRRSYDFAMQLDDNAFTRHAILHQVRAVNDRWTLYGTTVNVNPALDAVDIQSITTSVYVRAFVARYEGGRLAAHYMDKLRKLKGFSDQNTAVRVFHLITASLRWLWDHTFGLLGGVLHDVFDWFLTKYWDRPESKLKFVVRSVDMYVKVSSIAGGWREHLRANGEELTSLMDACRAAAAPNLSLPGGHLVQVLRAQNTMMTAANDALVRQIKVVTDVVETGLATVVPGALDFVKAAAAANQLDYAPSRQELEVSSVVREAGEAVAAFKMADVDDPAAVLNQFYLDAFPDVANQNFELDSHSLALDPQDRTMEAVYLRAPKHFGEPPRDREVYKSKVTALNVPKRQLTRQDMLSAVAARNLAAPALAVPQEQDVLIADVWNSFLDDWCVADARDKIAGFKADPAALEEKSLSDWFAQAKAGVGERVMKELQTQHRALSTRSVGEYLAMLKADVKPTLSNKPVNNLVAPQVIVYHEKDLSALYSSMFRVLVRRFLSLLKPEIHVNLLKDSKDVAAFIGAHHPYGDKSVKYLENDFSQFDKSQASFVFALEEFVFRELGLSEEFLQRWEIGHQYASVRCVATGLTLHVMYQRKSGDATTAFGNVLTNVLTVHYAYRGTVVLWAAFMGDDSLVCARTVCGQSTAVREFAERFNLIAKYYITDAPYLYSCFVVIDEASESVRLAPDPLKRIEKLSMDIPADDPQWHERWVSLAETLKGYDDVAVVTSLCVNVPQRYPVSEGSVRAVAGALGTLARNKSKFRALYDDVVTVIRG